MSVITQSIGITLTKRHKFEPFVSPSLSLNPTVEHLILVEGSNDLLIMHRLLEHVILTDLTIGSKHSEKFHIHSLDGHGHLFDELQETKGLLETDRESVKTLSIFFDADEDPDASFNGTNANGVKGICIVNFLKQLSSLSPPTYS